MIIGSSKSNVSVIRLQMCEYQLDGDWRVKFAMVGAEGKDLPVSEWRTQNHDGASWLCDLVDSSDAGPARVEVLSHRIEIPMSELVRQIEGQETYLQRLLELPRTFDGGVEVKGHGLLHQDNFQLSYNWITGSGRPIVAERRGSVLMVGKQRYWLPTHAYHLANHLDALQGTIRERQTIHQRLTELAEFKHVLSMLPTEEQHRVRQSSDLASLKLFYADAFRLEAVPDADSYSLRPVLLRRREEVGGGSSPVFESILPPAEQHRYAKYFSDSTVLLPHYNLGVGKYLIMSEKLNQVLGHIHKLQHASDLERKSFLKNPKAALLDLFGEGLEEDELDNIFSDRVIGIGDWQKKVIPWICIPPQNWLPDGQLPPGERGICIGETKVTLSQQQAQDLISQVRSALDLGQPTISFSGHTVPASSHTLKAIEDVFPDIPINPDNYQHPVQAQNQPKSMDVARPVMLVKQNLDALEFDVRRVHRTNVPSNTGLPDGLRTQPKPHQVDAFGWLCDHYRVGSRGVLLADDMGLGKTYQSLMFLSWLREAMDRGEIKNIPLLIVAPTGLLKNWEAELERHVVTDLGPLVRAYGAQLQSLKKGDNLDANLLRTAGLVLTTYETLTRYQTTFSAVTFGTVVFDEAQKLKNPGTQNYGAACSLNAAFWIAMTGTPIENRLSDIWSITDVLQPGMLGTIKEFSNKYEKSILEGEEVAQLRMQELQDGLSQPTSSAPAFMLRRLKHEKLPGLPEKHIEIHRELMPHDQTLSYTNVFDDVRTKGNRQKGAMLQALHKLRACSLHPDYKRERKHWHDEDFINASARLKACFSILDQIHKKQEKALIFIEYNDWHRPDFLPALIQRRYALKTLPMVIHGQVDSSARQSRVDEFQSDNGRFDVMLLSPKAGGVGLTLTAANHVIHLTRWWNPAVEDQATDRIYRIGQLRQVYIHYPLAIHPDIPDRCFDVLLNNILDDKRRLREQTLLSLPQSDDIAEELLNRGFDAGSYSSWTLSDSYLFSGQEFEDYVLSQLDKVAPTLGYRVRPTKKSWDGGADARIETTDGQVVGLVQCKHVSSGNKISEISPDLERAKKSYGCDDQVLRIGITNAERLSLRDQEWAKISGRNVIVSGEESLHPHTVFKQL